MFRTVTVAALFAFPALALSACSAPETPSSTPGTTPSIWTGSPSPSASPTQSEGAAAPSGDKLTAQLKNAAGAAENTANQLREAGWNVTETGNLTLEGVTATTVYFSDAPGERESADEVGQLLAAPVEPRSPELTEQPPGVIVAVTG